MSPSELLQSGEPIGFADFASILDVVGQSVILKDEASRFLHLNADACALLNVPLDSVRGRTDHDLLPREQADRIRAVDLEVLRSGRGRTFEEEITVADGSTRTLVTRKHPVNLSCGSPGKLLVAVISDVTEWRTAERVLRASEEHYRSLVELLPQIPCVEFHAILTRHFHPILTHPLCEPGGSRCG